MAAIPPPPPGGPVVPPAPPGTGARVGPTAGPINYLEKFQRAPDALHGNYQALLAPYASNSGNDHATLLTRLVTSSELVPKVFLALVDEGGGSYRTRTLHRIRLYPQHPVVPSHWDGRGLTFMGDVLPGNFVSIGLFPDTAFDVVGPVTVPTIPQADASLAGNAGQDVLLPFANGAANTENISVRHVVRVPHAYVPLVMQRNLSPRELWTQLGGAIRNDGREADCGIILQWIRAALCLQPDPLDGANFLAPVVSLGTAANVLQQLAADEDLQRYRWETLTSDLPALDPTRLAPTDQFVALLAAMRQERAAERAADAAARAAASGPKMPSAVFPTTTSRWMRLTRTLNERDLPPLYHRWATATKGERRQVFADLVEERGNEYDAATAVVPIVSKELYEIVLHGRFAPRPHEMDDLTLGLHPFTTGYFDDETGTEVRVRAQRFDTMMNGNAAPSLAEQDTFTTKEVPIPASVFGGGLQIKGCSVVLDVVLGNADPLAASYRAFCTRDWPSMEAILQLCATHDLDISSNVMPGILRWIQVHIGDYFQDLQRGNNQPELPNFRDLVRITQRRTFNLLPPLPFRYRVTTPASDGPTRGAAPVPAPAPAPALPGRGGAMVTNPSINRTWKTAFDNARRRLVELRSLAPVFANGAEVCLSYHLRGTCYDNCARAGTHRALNQQERTLMGTFCRDVLTSPAPAPAPAAPAPSPAA